MDGLSLIHQLCVLVLKSLLIFEIIRMQLQQVLLPFSLSKQFHVIPSCSSSNSCPPFTLIILVCIIPNTICSNHKLQVCMLSGMTTWLWIDYWCAVPWGTTSPPPSFPQLPIVICVGLMSEGLFSVYFSISIGAVLI